MLLIVFLLFLPLVALWVYAKLTCGICKCSKHLVGKTVIVTGGNAGIGFETAKDLADRGARVLLACRSKSLGNAAREKIVEATGNHDVHYRHLDLASLQSVRSFAAVIINNEERLDILINNAGIYGSELIEKTEDGLLLGMQSNHFGPFLLTNLLLPKLKSSAPSRIITVSSIMHKDGTVDLNNLNAEKETENTFKKANVYSASKLCNILMTIELTRRLKGTGVTANSLHPGVVVTDILSSIAILKYGMPLMKVFFKDSWEGAQTTIHLAVAPDVISVSGRYFVDCREAKTSKKAQDTELAQKLWEVSEIFVKLK